MSQVSDAQRNGLARRFSDQFMVQEREALERQRTQQALDWIARVLEVQALPKDAWAALGDGVQLCRLLTALYPDKQLIKKYNPPNSRRLLLLENITSFLNACKSKEVGISAAELFEANDLLDGKAAVIPRVVNVLRRLCTLAEERGFTEKWDPNAKVDAPAKLLSVEESKKAEEKAKAESDLEATRAKASAKFKKADSDSPAPTTESKKSGSSEKSADASKNQEKLIVELQKTAKTDAEENSPIHLAVKSKVLLPMLDALNPSKAELDKPNKHKQTALHIACQNGDYDAVEVLVKAGCSVNVSDDQDKTPLHYAVESNNTSLVTYLIDNGAEVDKQDKKKNTPLHLAARKGQKYSTLRLVQAGAKLNIMNESNEAPIQLATDGDHRGIIEVLVDNGASLNVNRSGDGWTPLYTAAYQGVLETVELFITNKAGVETQNSAGWTALHAAAEQGHLDVVTCLVKHKVKINIQNSQGVTPLYCAVNSNHPEIVKYLLKHGADVNAGKKGGWKPLHAAARKASIDVVKQLVEFGADLDEPNEEVKGYTPAMIATARGKGGQDILECLLAEGAAIDKTASNGATCLHLAAYWGHFDLVKLLVSKGAKLDVKNNRGLTPLDQAAKFGYAEVVEFLAKKMGVPAPKVKAAKQAKKADAIIPDLAPTPESLGGKSESSEKSSKKK